MQRIAFAVVVASFVQAIDVNAETAPQPALAPTFADLAEFELEIGATQANLIVQDVGGDPQEEDDTTLRFSSDEVSLTQYGDQGTWQFNMFVSGARGESGMDEDTFRDSDEAYYGGGIGIDYFIWDNFSAGAQLVGLKFDQDGPNTCGAGVEVLLRWHILTRDTWSMYIDGGAGFLKTSDDVPPHGSNWNFTPQAGAGFTFEIGGDMRAMTGVRWHHISNADFADSNPGIDSLMVYAGITVPF